MDGLLIINKPKGCTSHDVVAKLRRILSIKKIGHTGTLDPDATGVLCVCIGKATRYARYLPENEKEYRAVMKLGEVTDTQDASGKVIKETKGFSISAEQVLEAFKKFTGTIKQIPPMFSAVKVGGTPLYKMARKGQEVYREPREIQVREINLLEYSDCLVKFDVICSKGTYVRTLCNDIGAYLGVGAQLYSLERLASGEFNIKDSIAIEEVEELVKLGQIESRLININGMVAWMPSVKIRESWENAVKNGRGTPADAIQEISGSFDKDSKLRIMDSIGQFLSIGSSLYNSNEIMGIIGENVLKIERVLV
ncbi:MAG: tRNA pseudouridine(55) synthase TruB [Nitrospira sp.]|nr:tRNA pseudouridine(55) synthase TruB [Nitrospira sp.]